MLPLFADADPPPRACDRDGHVWTQGVYQWPDETVERLVWVCLHCSEMRGRA
jgi:hypothetical protein